jgi:hypothetical protein
MYDPTLSMAFCVNDGVCTQIVEYGQVRPGCQCQPGYTGAHCELYDTLQAAIAGAEITNNGHDHGPGDGTGDSAATLFACFVLGVLLVFLLLVLVLRYRGLREQERRALDDQVRAVYLDDVNGRPAGGRRHASAVSSNMEEVDFDPDFDERDLEEVELL